MYSNNTYTLIGSVAQVQASQVVNSGECSSAFIVKVNSSNRLQWWYEQGTLVAQVIVGGTTTTLASLTYSHTTHLWWRIREAGGTVFWETSADGTTWTQRASRATSAIGFSLTAMRPGFHVETWGSGDPSPGAAKFARFN
jgi:hypothetical protein